MIVSNLKKCMQPSLGLQTLLVTVNNQLKNKTITGSCHKCNFCPLHQLRFRSIPDTWRVPRSHTLHAPCNLPTCPNAYCPVSECRSPCKRNTGLLIFFLMVSFVLQPMVQSSRWAEQAEPMAPMGQLADQTMGQLEEQMAPMGELVEPRALLEQLAEPTMGQLVEQTAPPGQLVEPKALLGLRLTLR